MNRFSTLAKPTLLLFFLIAFSVVMFYGASFLVPMAYGAIFAFLVSPVFKKLKQLKLNKYAAALLSISLIWVFIFILFSVFGWQIQELGEQSDDIKKELVAQQQQLQSYVKSQFGISFGEQEKQAEKVVENIGKKVSGFLGGIMGILGNIFLSFIYAIMFLTEAKRMKKFCFKLADERAGIEETIDKTGDVIQSYLTGKLIIISILATAYSIGFLIAGIKYAILIAVLTAFLSFIPYVGNIIGGFIAAMITLSTGGSSNEIFIVFGIMGFAQLIESYILEPWIVGGNVDLNPLFSIITVIALSTLWGAAGSIIALPLAGVLKIIFDQSDKLKPFGFLMGDADFELDGKKVA